MERYEEKLKQATFYYNRAEGYISKGKHTTAETFYSKSESVCEGLSADIVSLTRLVTSRSNERLNEDSRIANKQDVKLSVVERVIHNIGRD